jgi:transcriptional regulator with XRE-family HTH domain
MQPLTVPEQLRGARAWAERSQVECAAVLGISRESYRSREAGAPALTPEEMDRLAALLGAPRARVFPGAAPPEPLAATLLEQLRYWRGVADLSLDQAAAAIGVTREAYRQREKGTTPITGAELALLARAYGRPLLAIFPAYQPSAGEVALARALAEAGRLE